MGELLASDPPSAASDSERIALLEEKLQLVLSQMYDAKRSNDAEGQKQMQPQHRHQFSPKTDAGPHQETAPSTAEEGRAPKPDTNEKTNSEEEDGQVRLNQDSFSFLITARPLSFPFVTGLLATIVKDVIFYLVMMNLIDYASPFNKFGIPVSVSTPVLFSQFLAFGISVFTQNDLLTGMVLLYQGYSKEIKDVYGKSDCRTGGGGRFGQWLFAVYCLFVDGLFGLAVTFMLIITSSTVLDVLLNFAAVEFVAGLDEAVFSLCEMGFLGRLNKLEADLVSESTHKPKRNQGSKLFQVMGLVAILGVVLSFWGYIYSMQVRGVYSPKTLIVQFDDQVRPELAAHSGLYVLQTNAGTAPSNRFQYNELRAGGGHFGYCLINREWTFSVGSPVDPCNYSNVLAKSIKTETYDMTQLAGEAWFVIRESVDQAIPMQDFFMAIACEAADDCSGRGRCTRDNRCECQAGTFGVRCEHSVDAICPEVKLDERFATQFQAVRTVSTVFKQVPNSFVYHRPVYVNATTNDTIVFTGVRWAISNFEGLDISSMEALASLDQNGLFDASSILSVDLLSDPVVWQTPADAVVDPIDVAWWVVSNRGSLSTAQPVAPSNPTVFLCSACSADNRCSYNNECVERTCQCRNGGSGTLCQIAPLSDGKCDPFFNSHEFGYDGGDCCQATCVGIVHNKCGVVWIGGVPNIDVGFPYCIDPDVVGQCTSVQNKTTCLIRNSQPVPSIGSGTAFPTLSANGRVLVLAEPLISVVRVFDLVGSIWVQRGRTLVGTGSFGKHVAISTPPATVLNGATVRLPMLLVVWSATPSNLRMFRWSTLSVDWAEEQVHEYSGRGVTRLELASDLMNVPRGNDASSTRLLIDTPPPVSLEIRQGREIVHVRGDPMVEIYEGSGTPRTVLTGTYPSSVGALSGNGNFLVRTHSTGGPRIILSDLWKNETSDVDLPGVTPQDEIIGIGLVVIDQTIDSSREIEYGELGLSIVVSTGRDDSGTQRLAIRYFALERANATLASSTRAVEETKMNVTRVVFSSDGLSLLLVSTENGLLSSRPFVLDTTRTHWLQAADMESSFAFVVNPIEQYTADVPVSISSGNGRIRVADGSSGKVQVMESAAMCSSDEFTFRLIMTPNADAGSIDWTVFEYGTYLGYTFPRSVIRACTGCYHNWNLAWTVLVEEFCLPKPLPICLALQVSARFDVPVNGFAAYLIGGGNSTLLMAAEGRGVTGEQYLHAGMEVDCEMDPVPSDCPFPLVIAYKLSNRVDSLYAGTSSRGDVVYMKGSNVNVVCRPSPDCDTLFLEDFTIVRGNPNLYFGNYSVFFNGKQILGGAWEPALNESVRFGTRC